MFTEYTLLLSDAFVIVIIRTCRVVGKTYVTFIRVCIVQEAIANLTLHALQNNTVLCYVVEDKYNSIKQMLFIPNCVHKKVKQKLS